MQRKSRVCVCARWLGWTGCAPLRGAHRLPLTRSPQNPQPPQNPTPGLLSSAAWASGVSEAFSKYAGDPTTDSQTTWKYVAYAMTAVAGLVFLLTLLMLRRVRIAVACLKVASQAVGSMPSVLLFPILPFIFEVGLIIYWVSVTAVLYTAGERTYSFRTPASADGLTFSSLSGAPTSPADDTATGKPSDWATYTDAAKCVGGGAARAAVARCFGGARCSAAAFWGAAVLRSRLCAAPPLSLPYPTLIPEPSNPSQKQNKPPPSNNN